MKAITIDGTLYGIRLPTGGMNKDDIENEWDRALNAGCELNWTNNYSWCLETVRKNFRTVRGYVSDRYWHYYPAYIRAPRLGFRPVLVPLDPATMEPDYSLYAGMDGQTIKLGTFAYDHNSNIVIDDTSWGVNTGKTIEWAIFDGKLISTRVLESNISWDELDKMGFCTIAIIDDPERKQLPMSAAEFASWLSREFSRFPILVNSNPLSLNELVYVLRMSGKDFNISWQTGKGATTIPSIQKTFIPSRYLAQKISIEDYEEEEIDGVTQRFITVGIIENEKEK